MMTTIERARDGYGLSDEHLMSIALIGLKWADSEAIVGSVVATIYRLEGDAKPDLVHSLPYSKLLALLITYQRRKRGPEGLSLLVTELNLWSDRVRGDRNLLAHGLWFSDTEGGLRLQSLQSDKASSSPEDLTTALDRTLYIEQVALRMVYAFTPVPAVALPDPPQWP